MGTWNHLLPFVTVMKEGSFKRAAQRMAVTPAALSQSIAQLERKLGVRLFHRTTRQLHATDEGRILYESLGGLVVELEQRLRLIDDLRGEPSGLIRLAISSAFGRRRVVPAIGAFLNRYPKVAVEMLFESHPQSLAQSGMDLAVRHGTKHAGYIARPICRMDLLLVASPEYLERRGTPRTISDLEENELIASRMADGTMLKLKWTRRHAERFPEPSDASFGSLNPAGGAPRIVVSGQIDAVRETALAGLGIASIFTDYVEHNLASGDLVQVLPDFDFELPRADDATIYLQYPDRTFLPARVRALIDHIVAETGKRGADRARSFAGE